MALHHHLWPCITTATTPNPLPLPLIPAVLPLERVAIARGQVIDVDLELLGCGGHACTCAPGDIRQASHGVRQALRMHACRGARRMFLWEVWATCRCSCRHSCQLRDLTSAHVCMHARMHAHRRPCCRRTHATYVQGKAKAVGERGCGSTHLAPAAAWPWSAGSPCPSSRACSGSSRPGTRPARCTCRNRS